MRELSTNDFIKKANSVHKNRYDYSKSIYVNNITKVVIICSKHGEFEQTPHHHKRGGGCPKCTLGANPMLLREFVKKAKEIHGNKYDYSNVEYKNNRTKIDIECSSHGLFKQTPGAHLLGQGCPQCNKGFVKISEIINRINKVHKNVYEYDFSNYKGVSGKVFIKCKIHGEFEQRLSDHLNGCGCPKCSATFRLDTKEFIQKSIHVHQNKYDYSKVKYKTSKSKIEIICPKHGVFKQTPNSHIKGQGCPVCKLSKGEMLIEKLLTESNIKFIRQHKFDDCKNRRSLPFDFYLPNQNVCIEFNGRQHYEPVIAFGGEKTFKETLKNDKIKESYCKNNNINLLTIKYTDNIFNELKVLNDFKFKG